MNHRPPRPFRLDFRRSVHLLTALFFLGVNLPGPALAMGLPEPTARPGAGVSRMPLDVVHFNAPGFGELNTAINLANGNLFVSGDQVSHNNLTTPGTDETTQLFGGGWNFTPRMRLAGFNRSLTDKSLAPSSYTLFEGDGSSLTFNKVSTGWNPALLGGAPSWIARYQNYDAAAPGTNAGVVYYKNQPQVGTQYREEWLVLVVQPWNNTVAHYYTHGGYRYSFEYQGEYLDHSQTPAEQYRGAQAGDQEGEAEVVVGCSPCNAWATNYWYTSYGNGNINMVNDLSYGRNTYYDWNPDGTLKAVYLGSTATINTWPLPADLSPIRNSSNRIIELQYAAPAGVNVVSSLRFITYDGLSPNPVMPTFGQSDGSGWIARTYRFGYTTGPGGQVLLSKLDKPILGGNNYIEYQYAYDSQGRLTQVAQKAGGNPTQDYEPVTNYTYITSGTASANTTVDGPSAVGTTGNNGAIINALPCSQTLSEGLGGSALELSCTDSAARYAIPTNLIPGVYQVSVTARAINGSPTAATLTMRQNGTTLSSANVSNANYGTYTLGQAYLQPSSVGSPSYLDINFINAYTDPLGVLPRSAVVDYITLTPTGATGATQTVTVTQGSDANYKQSVYQFDASGQLLQRRVRDYNPLIQEGSFLVLAATPAERWLETDYSYYPSGNTQSVTLPTGAKTQYGYDSRGNLTARQTYVAGGSLERETDYAYDADNRMTRQTLLGQSGSRDGIAYSYANRSTNYTYTPQATVTFTNTSTGGYQTFTQVGSITTSQNLGSSAYSQTLDNYDPYGRLSDSTRSGFSVNGYNLDSLSQKTSYSYYPGNTTFAPYLPTAAGDIDAGVRAAQTRQYADWISQVNDGQVTKSYFYDTFGNLNTQIDTLGFTKDFDSSGNQVRIDRGTAHAYDGFGDQIWKVVWNGDGEFSRQRSFYYSTGELQSSWEGNPSNVTQYVYYPDSKDVGRLLRIFKGVGANGVVSTPHSTQALAFDAYGRNSYGWVDQDTYVTKRSFDTLDRVVNEILPDGSSKKHTFDPLGNPAWDMDYPISPAGTDTYLGTYRNLDSLGRVFRTDYDAHTWGKLGSGQTGSSVYFTYDPYDRLIKQLDNRLSMDAANDDRATVMQYDSLGNLVKTLGPVLSSSPQSGGYSDTRRPYAEYTYDGFNHRRKTQTLLSGSLGIAALNPLAGSPSASLFSSSTTSATTTTVYDAYDRPVSFTDPLGYSTSLSYDPSGEVVQSVQQVCQSGDTLCTNGSGGPNFSTQATTRTAYDALGRAFKVWSPRAVNEPGTVFPQLKTYDLNGNLLAQTDERNVTVKAYHYTADGLVDLLAEPDPNSPPATGVQLFSGTTPPGGYVVTKRLSYSSRVFPTSSCAPQANATSANAASQDARPGNPGACTSYTYDYAGRPTLTSLPDGSSLTQTYDGRGHQTSLKDPEGFITNSAYDSVGKLVQESKPVRVGNSNDAAALPSGSLTTSYNYDFAGNLIQQVKGNDANTLITDYAYNSLGKVIAENRPHTAAASSAYFKYKTYRLDGGQTAETSYDYAGDALSSWYGSVSADTLPALSAGNVTAWNLDPQGNRVKEVSKGPTGAYADSSGLTLQGLGLEATTSNTFNGLGLKVYRNFQGHPGIYAAPRNPGGNAPGSSYTSNWVYDANAKLLESYDQLPGDSSKYNHFSYTRTPTGKEASSAHDVESWYHPQTPTLTLTTVYTSAATTGGVSGIAYNGRDQLLSASISNQAPSQNQGSGWVGGLGAISNYTLSTAYYLDGSKQKVSGPNGSTTLTYDNRGRETQVVDSNGYLTGAYFGTPTYSGPRTINTSYASDGSVTRSIDGETPPSAVTGNTFVVLSPFVCTTSAVDIPTVGGLSYQHQEYGIALAKTVVSGGTTPVCDPSLRLERTTVFRSDAQPDHSSGRSLVNFYSGPTYNSQATTFAYDPYGNQGNINAYITPPTGAAFTQTLSNTFTTNNALIRVTSTVTNAPSTGTQYVLDSRGNRLASSGSSPFDPTNNATKRYDATGQVAEFSGSLAGDTSGATHTLTFRYDPQGNEVLSADFNFYSVYNDPPAARSVQTADVRPLATIYYWGVINDANLYLNGEVQVIHQVQGGNEVTVTLPDLVRDGAYSLVDGFQEKPWAIAKPFGVTGNNPGGFQAPQDPKNRVLKLPPLAVNPANTAKAPSSPSAPTDTKAPPSSTPAGSSPTTPTPPQGKAPSQDDKSGSSTATTQSVGQGQTAGTIAPVGTLGPTGKANLTQNRPDVSGAQFQAPQKSPLPSSVQAVSPQSVTAPNAARLPVTATQPQEGPTGVVAPGSVANPKLPPVGGNDPTSVNTPPGWKPQANGTGRIGSLGIDDIQSCTNGYNSSSATCNPTPATPSQEAGNHHNQQQGATGGDSSSPKTNQLVQEFESLLKDPNVRRKYGLTDADSVNINTILKFVDTWTNPAEKLNLLSKLSILVAVGDPMNRTRVLETMARLADYGGKAKVNGTATDLRGPHQPAYFKGLVFEALGNPLDATPGAIDRARRETISLLLSLTPIGIVTGAVGAITKYDPITGDELALWQRGLGALAGLGAVAGAAAKFVPLLREVAAESRAAALAGCNSFSSNTKVVLASGAMAAISTLGVGSNVLAFNQQTQTKGSYTVTATHKNLDPKVTYLTLKTHSEKRELVETTPEHPFMTNKGWVFAGKLQVGEQIREKGGYYGTVVFNKTIDRTQTMYNLTVATAHTFYVGSGQWLVHNQSNGKPPLTATERSVLAEATRFFKPEIMDKILAAYEKGVPASISVGGRTILIEPKGPFSGFTNFEGNSFAIGGEAFKSTEELQKTILHELYRLKTSGVSSGLSGAMASSETNAAAGFADKAHAYLFGGCP